jgi:hypothetical protein
MLLIGLARPRALIKYPLQWLEMVAGIRNRLDLQLRLLTTVAIAWTRNAPPTNVRFKGEAALLHLSPNVRKCQEQKSSVRKDLMSSEAPLVRELLVTHSA